MKTRLIDLTGKRFGRLIVVRRGENHKQGQARWICLCDCGNETLSSGRHLRNGNTKSCGCYGLSKTIKTCTTHGKWKTREYRIWQGIKNRCLNKNNPEYKYYGGRGILICDEWVNSFEKFFKDMGESNGLSIDRFPNCNGNYEKSNCRWATKKEQARNTSRNVWISFNGENKIIYDWSVLFKSSIGNIQRMMKKKTFEEVYNHFMK